MLRCSRIANKIRLATHVYVRFWMLQSGFEANPHSRVLTYSFSIDHTKFLATVKDSNIMQSKKDQMSKEVKNCDKNFFWDLKLECLDVLNVQVPRNG
jgi:hypothetical protein